MDGEVVNADVVISNADPKRTFLGLLREADLDDELVAEVKALKTQAASVKLLCAMRELPDFSGYLGAEHDPRLLAMVGLCPSIDTSEMSWNDAKDGRVSDIGHHPTVQIPSVHD